MKKTRIAALLIAAFSLVKMNMAMAKEKPLVFVENGIPKGKIVVAEKPDEIGFLGSRWGGTVLDRTQTVQYAAEFLQKYIEKVTGVKLEIVADGEAGSNVPVICVGRSKLTGFVENERKQLLPEGFIIRRKGNVVAIVGEIAPENGIPQHAGADRGTLWGVFEFLEQACGVRWYFPHELGTVVPGEKTMSVGEINVEKHPVFRMRTGAIYHSEQDITVEDLLPVTRHGNTTGFSANHTHFGWEIMYGDRYPEIFAVGPDGESTLKKGESNHKYNRVCYSNPRVLELELEHIKNYCEKGIKDPWKYGSAAPFYKYIPVVPKDLENLYYCRCDKCSSKWVAGTENSKLSELIFGYVGQVAGEVKKLYPGKRIAALAYCGFLFPPAGAFPDNVDVMICTVKGGSKLSAPGHWQHNVDLVNQWYEKVNRDPSRLFLFEYMVYPSVNVPDFCPHTMQKWFRFLNGKVSGGFNNAASSKGMVRYRFSLLNGWLWHKLLWNPDLDMDALLDDYYGNLFGPAEKPMKELFSLCADRWENASWGNAINAGGCSYVSDKFLYREIYPAGVVEKMKNLLAEGREKAGTDTVYRKRVEYFGEAFEAFFKNAQAFYSADISPVEYGAKFVGAPLPDRDRIDAGVWKDIEPVTLKEWKLGEDPPCNTEVRMFNDGKRLYMRLNMEGQDVNKLVANTPKDGDPAIFRDDRVEIAFDVRKKNYLQPETFYKIVVNSAGKIATGVQMVPCVFENAHVSSWNEFWSPSGLLHRVNKKPGLWSVDITVPFDAFPELINKDVEKIKIQVVRINVSEPRGIFAWSPMLAETYECPLERFGTVLMRNAS